MKERGGDVGWERRRDGRVGISAFASACIAAGSRLFAFSTGWRGRNLKKRDPTKETTEKSGHARESSTNELFLSESSQFPLFTNERATQENTNKHDKNTKSSTSPLGQNSSQPVRRRSVLHSNGDHRGFALLNDRDRDGFPSLDGSFDVGVDFDVLQQGKQSTKRSRKGQPVVVAVEGESEGEGEERSVRHSPTTELHSPQP